MPVKSFCSFSLSSFNLFRPKWFLRLGGASFFPSPPFWEAFLRDGGVEIWLGGVRDIPPALCSSGSGYSPTGLTLNLLMGWQKLSGNSIFEQNSRPNSGGFFLFLERREEGTHASLVFPRSTKRLSPLEDAEISSSSSSRKKHKPQRDQKVPHSPLFPSLCSVGFAFAPLPRNRGGDDAPALRAGRDLSTGGRPSVCKQTKKKELGEGENVVLFQSFRELVALDVDLNKNPETSDFCVTQPLCLEEKKGSIQKARLDWEVSGRGCGAVGLF